MKYCKDCEEPFPAYSKYNKICKKCFKKSHNESMGRVRERRKKGEDTCKPYYLRE